MLIRPHGGTLVNRVLNPEQADRAKKTARDLPRVTADPSTLRDIENIAKGVYSPLEGFVGQEDFDSILYRNRLMDGSAWTIPILLSVSREEADRMEIGSPVAVADDRGEVHAILHLTEKFPFNKEELAKRVYGTTDEKHPGVVRVKGMQDILLAGPVDLVRTLDNPYDSVTLDPVETRVLFRERGFSTVCAFQTRNVPHVGHEDMQRSVLGLVDALLIQPVIGKKKAGDFTDPMIIKAYQTLIKEYYNPERVILSVLPTEMRYAGPKEAIHHAIMRKNFGCTHMIVGRDHAGVGNFYGEEAAIEIFQQFPDLEIQPITIRGDFYHCKRCAKVVSNRTCLHPESEQIPFSGTLIRNGIKEGKNPPAEIMRPEVFEVLRGDPQPFVT